MAGTWASTLERSVNWTLSVGFGFYCPKSPRQLNMTGWKFLGDFLFRFAPSCEPGERLARFCPAKGGVDIVDTRVHVMP